MKRLFAKFLAVLSTPAFSAGFIDCGVTTIDKVYVQANRQDNSSHQNSLLIQMGQDKLEACENVSFGQLKNTDPAYDGVLSMAMAAYFSGGKLRVVLNTNGSGTTYPIAWVNVSK